MSSSRNRDIKMLIVEDDYNLYKSIDNILTSEGYNSDYAQNGKVACKKISGKKYDLILSDIQMPVMTGIELLEWLKGSQSANIILMSGFSDIMSLGEALKIGAVGFIPKPFQRDDLLDYINLYIESRSDNKKILADFISIPITGFAPTHPYSFHLYLKMGDSNLMKINHRHQKIDLAILSNIKDYTPDRLWLHNSSLESYLNETFEIAFNLLKSTKVNAERLIRFYSALEEAISCIDPMKVTINNVSIYKEQYSQLLEGLNKARPDVYLALCNQSKAS